MPDYFFGGKLGLIEQASSFANCVHGEGIIDINANLLSAAGKIHLFIGDIGLGEGKNEKGQREDPGGQHEQVFEFAPRCSLLLYFTQEPDIAEIYGLVSPEIEKMD